MTRGSVPSAQESLEEVIFLKHIFKDYLFTYLTDRGHK